MKKDFDIFMSEVIGRSARYSDDLLLRLNYKPIEYMPGGEIRCVLNGTLDVSKSYFTTMLIFCNEADLREDRGKRLGYIQRFLRDKYSIESILEEEGLKVISLVRQVKEKLSKF